MKHKHPQHSLRRGGYSLALRCYNPASGCGCTATLIHHHHRQQAGCLEHPRLPAVWSSSPGEAQEGRSRRPLQPVRLKQSQRERTRRPISSRRRRGFSSRAPVSRCPRRGFRGFCRVSAAAIRPLSQESLAPPTRNNAAAQTHTDATTGRAQTSPPAHRSPAAPGGGLQALRLHGNLSLPAMPAYSKIRRRTSRPSRNRRSGCETSKSQHRP